MKQRDEKLPTSIQISDQHTIRQVAEEQERQGDATATKTAGRLIIERLRELELERRDKPAVA